MDLAEYIQQHGLLEDSVVDEITNMHLVKKFTFFEELYKDGQKYGVSEENLLTWALDASVGSLKLIPTSKGLDIDPADYQVIGGITACIRLQIMPVRGKSNELCIVTRRPDDMNLIVQLNKVFGSDKYTLCICTKFIWDSIYQLNVEPLFIEAEAQQLSQTMGARGGAQERVRESEARQIYNRILQLGIARRASDIHLIPCTDECRALYRIDGINYQLMKIPKVVAARIANLLCIDGKIPQKGPEVPLDGKIRYQAPEVGDGQERDLRFSVMPSTKGPDINIRYLNNRLYTFAELGMSELNMNKYMQVLNMPQGLVMQVGPTGSGKSTTLYTGLSYIHENSLRNIITVEDPVEIAMDGITQVSTNDDAKLTFARVARQFLRHDVDVGVIGEIRDEETALEAVRAATTGHLIISSLHTNDSVGVLERLNRLGVDPYTLGEVLVAIMGQRLVRRLCAHCKEAYKATWDDPWIQKFNIPKYEGEHTFYRAAGCEHCNNLGYRGRIAVNEILIVDDQLRNMIQMHETRFKIQAYLKEAGFKTMYSDALDKALIGVTSLEELEPMRSDTLAYK